MRRGDEDSAPAPTLAQPWAQAWTAARVIQTLEPLVLEERRGRLKTVLAGRLDSVTVLLDSPRDPHNGAAVLRSSDAFGVQTVHVVTHDESFLLARRVTTGAERWVDTVQHDSAADAVSALRARHYMLVAAHPAGTLEPKALASVPRLALVLGSEHAGISPELRAAVDATVSIPMRGFVESLNLSVSAAVLLAAATRDRPGDLSPAQFETIYADWLCKSVPRALEVLEGTLARELQERGHAASDTPPSPR